MRNGPPNKALQQTKRGMERTPGSLGVINVRFAAERQCSADDPRCASHPIW